MKDMKRQEKMLVDIIKERGLVHDVEHCIDDKTNIEKTIELLEYATKNWNDPSAISSVDEAIGFCKKHINGDNQKTLGITIVRLYKKDDWYAKKNAKDYNNKDGCVGIGVAYCSLSERHFSKRKGRIIAIGRALQHNKHMQDTDYECQCGECNSREDV